MHWAAASYIYIFFFFTCCCVSSHTQEHRRTNTPSHNPCGLKSPVNLTKAACGSYWLCTKTPQSASLRDIYLSAVFISHCVVRGCGCVYTSPQSAHFFMRVCVCVVLHQCALELLMSLLSVQAFPWAHVCVSTWCWVSPRPRRGSCHRGSRGEQINLLAGFHHFAG